MSQHNRYLVPPEHAPHIVGLRKPPARLEGGGGGAGRQRREEGVAASMGTTGDEAGLFRDLSVPTFDIVEVCVSGVRRPRRKVSLRTHIRT